MRRSGRLVNRPGAHRHHEYGSPRPLIEESLELFRGLGNEARVMWGTRTLAWAYSELGDLGRARPLYEDALRQARVASNRLFERVVLGSLAWLAFAQERVQEAPALMKEGLRIQGVLRIPLNWPSALAMQLKSSRRLAGRRQQRSSFRPSRHSRGNSAARIRG